MPHLSPPLPAQQHQAPAEALLSLSLHAKVRALIEYWISICPADGRLPGRQHVDPLDIPSLLPNVWMIDVERRPATRLRYRLVGTSVARAFDADMTGQYLDAAHPDFAGSPVWGHMRAVLERAEPSWRVGPPHFGRLQGFQRLERLYLPMARDGATVDMILALTVFLDRLGDES